MLPEMALPTAADITEKLLASKETCHINHMCNPPEAGGYLVAMKSRGLVLEAFDYETVITWVRHNLEDVKTDLWGALYFGVRTDPETGAVHLDIYDNYRDFYGSLLAAHFGGQSCVYDVTNKDYITV